MNITESESGFTVPELVTVMVVSLLFVNLIMFFGYNFWRTSILQGADQDTLITRLNAGDYLRENVGESAGLIIQNSLPDNSALAPDPAYANGFYWLPIHAIPGQISVGGNGTITPLLYFRKFSVNKSKAVVMNGTVPYEDEYILYLNGTTKQLLARTIANNNVANNKVSTTCSPTTATSTCPADKVVADSVSSVNMRYFSKTGTPLDYTSSTDPSSGAYNGPDFPIVEVVEFTINLQEKPLFEKSIATQNSTVIRIALRNS